MLKKLKSMVCAAGLGWAALAAGASIPADKLGHFVVPRLAQPPVIDGTIAPEEWSGALAVSGLASQNPGGNQLIMRPTTFYLMWDADNIYLACRTVIMPGYKPRVSGRAHNTATAHDDGLEFNLMPQGANVPPAGSDSSYKFFINCLGSHGDMGRVSVGQIFRAWQPKFNVAVRQTAPGSGPAGGSWWEMEVVFPAKEFGLVGPNQAGDVWKMLLAFNHIPAWMQAAIPINSGYFDASGYPTFVLAENVPAVQVTMDERPGLEAGVAAVKFQVFNPTAHPVTVNVQAEFAELLKREQTLTVAPGQTGVFAISEKPAGALGDQPGGLFYRVTQGDKELYRYFAFFEFGDPKVWHKFNQPAPPFSVSAGFNPVRSNLRLRADTYYLPDPAQAQAVRYVVRRDGDTKPVAEGVIEEVEHFYFERLLELPNLREGDYTVETTLALRDGKTIGPEKATFKKFDEAKEFAAWWGNNLGRTDRLIPPFSKISRRSGGRLELLGRAYTLDALGLPAGIVAADGEVLAAAARVVVVVDGQEHVVPVKGAPDFTERRDWRYAFKGKAKAAGLAFSAAGTVEQDGLVTVNLTFAPEGKAAVAIDALRLEFPVRGEVAESLVCIGAGGNFSSHTGMLLPAGKTGRLWSTLDTGIGGSMMMVGSFYPQVWLGNERRGLLWWADSDQGWTPVNEVPAHEVVREEGAGFRVQGSGADNDTRHLTPGTHPEPRTLTPDTCITLRNNIISIPETLAGPRTLTFSYMASPFKPLPKGWRMAIYSEDGTFSTAGHKKRVDPKSGGEINGWNWLNPPSYDPAEWSALWAEHKQKADAKVREQQWRDPAAARNKDWVHTSIPMRGYGVQTSDGKVANYFQPEWGDGNYNPSMTDYLLWLADRSFREGGLRTIYWDIFYVTVIADLQAGYGYRLPDGRIQPTFHGYNLRRFMMRLYALMNDHGLTPGANVTHSSNAFPLVAFPWVDAVLDGEFVFFRDATVGGFADFYPSARMRAMATSHNWGTQNSWMMLNHIVDKARYWREHRIYTDWQRMHDTWRGQDNRVPPDSILEWGLNDQRLVYTPYWRATATTGATDNLQVSAWTLPDRALLLVFNGDGKAVRDGKVTVDLKALGLPAGEVTVKEIGGAIGNGLPLNAPKDPEVAFDPVSGTLAVPGLQPHTARYIGIRVQAPADLERGRREFASVGHGAELTEAMLDWGLLTAATRFRPAGQAPEVKSDAPQVQVALWQLPDRVLLAVTNTGEQDVPVTLAIDLDRLGLTPRLPWQEFIRIRDFDGGHASLDFHARKLSLGVLKPGQVRLVGVRRY